MQIIQRDDYREVMDIIGHISPVPDHMKRKYCERCAQYGSTKGFAVLFFEMDDVHRQALADYLTTTN